MTKRDSHLHACVLAGGSGRRFWPLSRELSPKQLLSMFGTESLITQAVHRVMPFVGSADGVWVVTNELFFDELRSHLTAQQDPALHQVHYLREPMARNTAAAIALAAATLLLHDPDAVMVVLPSDHVLEGGQLWADCIESGAKAARAGWLTTIGIRPTRAETGYGYVKAAELLPDFAYGDANPRRAERFVEKPDAASAERYLESGEYLWNAGIFIARADTLLQELERLSDDGRRIAEAARFVAGLPPQEHGGSQALAAFETLPSVPIDCAVLELSDKVAVIPAALAWNDVGSLLALEDLAEPDGRGNVRCGRGVDIDTQDTVVYSGDRLVATLGLKDLLVVDTTDATLVLPKERAQEVRRVFDALKAAGEPEVTTPKKALRPWGSWQNLLSDVGYQIRVIDVKPGARLSLQRHAQRSEHWVVVAGTAQVTRDAEKFELRENESAFIPPGVIHRLANSGSEPLRVIEVRVGAALGDDDVERIEDDWGRL